MNSEIARVVDEATAEAKKSGNGSVEFAHVWAALLRTDETLANRFAAPNPALDEQLEQLPKTGETPTIGPELAEVLTSLEKLPGDRFALTVGQYPIANFDGNAYANNQQVNFLGYSVAQNGSQNYSQGSLGAYLQLNPDKDVWGNVEEAVAGTGQFFMDFLVPHPNGKWLPTNPATSPENFPDGGGNKPYFDEVTAGFRPGTTICAGSSSICRSSMICLVIL